MKGIVHYIQNDLDTFPWIAVRMWAFDWWIGDILGSDSKPF